MQRGDQGATGADQLGGRHGAAGQRHRLATPGRGEQGVGLVAQDPRQGHHVGVLPGRGDGQREVRLLARAGAGLGDGLVRRGERGRIGGALGQGQRLGGQSGCVVVLPEHRGDVRTDGAPSDAVAGVGHLIGADPVEHGTSPRQVALAEVGGGHPDRQADVPAVALGRLDQRRVGPDRGGGVAGVVEGLRQDAGRVPVQVRPRPQHAHDPCGVPAADHPRPVGVEEGGRPLGDAAAQVGVEGGERLVVPLVPGGGPAQPFRIVGGSRVRAQQAGEGRDHSVARAPDQRGPRVGDQQPGPQRPVVGGIDHRGRRARGRHRPGDTRGQQVEVGDAVEQGELSRSEVGEHLTTQPLADGVGVEGAVPSGGVRGDVHEHRPPGRRLVHPAGELGVGQVVLRGQQGGDGSRPEAQVRRADLDDGSREPGQDLPAQRDPGGDDQPHRVWPGDQSIEPSVGEEMGVVHHPARAGPRLEAVEPGRLAVAGRRHHHRRGVRHAGTHGPCRHAPQEPSGRPLIPDGSSSWAPRRGETGMTFAASSLGSRALQPPRSP